MTIKTWVILVCLVGEIQSADRISQHERNKKEKAVVAHEYTNILSDDVRNCAFSSDTNLVVQLHYTNELRRYDLDCGDEYIMQQELTSVPARRRSALAPDGSAVVSTKHNKNYVERDVIDSERQKIPCTLAAQFSQLVCSDGARIIAGIHKKQLWLWDARRGISGIRNHDHLLTSLDVAASGSNLVTATATRLYVYSLHEPVNHVADYPYTTQYSASSCDQVKLSADGRSLFVARKDGIELWQSGDDGNFSPVRTRFIERGGELAAIDRSGSVMAILHGRERCRLKICSMDDDHNDQHIPCAETLHYGDKVVFSPSRTFLAVRTATGHLEVFHHVIPWPRLHHWTNMYLQVMTVAPYVVIGGLCLYAVSKYGFTT